MSAETPTFTEEVSNNMLKELQSWWEIPSTAQYISLFRESFNLPEIEIEDLEKGLIDDTIKGPSEWLQNLIFAFLKSIMPTRVNANNWEVQLQRLIKRKWTESPFAEKENPFEEDKAFHELKLRSKVEIIYCFCLYRLDNNDITELMKSMDADALRVQKLGFDDAGSSYWYFYGTRLYKEEAIEEKKAWNEEWNEQKRKSLIKRGRGRPRKKQPVSDGENVYDDPSKNNKMFMNVSEKSRWSVACETLEEWVKLAEKFKNSKSKNEKSLFGVVQEDFLPTLSQIYEEKEEKLQEKVKELLPLREKIVTRRETRRLRGDTGGDIDYALLNGYYSDEDFNFEVAPVTKDRATRLEERNKRASEIENVENISDRKRVKHDKAVNESSCSSYQDNSDSSDIDLQSQMVKLLSNVKLHKDAWPFLYPVDEGDAPGYYEIIKDPVDLSKIENRLYKGEYETIGDLDEDFSKMVSNCELYNGENHAYSKMAQTLRKLFRKEIANLLEALEAVESSNVDSEGSSDSQYHSSSNSASPPHESPTVGSKQQKKHKGKNKKKRHNMEALDLLAQASDIAVQDNSVDSASQPQKKSPILQEIQAAPFQVPSTSIPSTSLPSNLASTSSPIVTKPPVVVSSPSFISTNSAVQGVKKARPVIVKAKPSEVEKRISPVANVVTTSFNTPSKNNDTVVHQNNVYQTYNPKTVPVVVSGSPSNQNALTLKNNHAVTMQSNVCMPNGLPVVQQVMIPAGTQIANNGQYVFASPQNTIRLLSKDQSVQIQNSIGHLSPGFVKVMPQIVTQSPIMQLSKDGFQGLQFQTLSPNDSQAFTQVAQNPQFVNVPYMITNQNTAGNSSQSIMNFQPFQLPPRQMQISGQGNS